MTEKTTPKTKPFEGEKLKIAEELNALHIEYSDGGPPFDRSIVQRMAALLGVEANEAGVIQTPSATFYAEHKHFNVGFELYETRLGWTSGERRHLSDRGHMSGGSVFARTYFETEQAIRRHLVEKLDHEKLPGPLRTKLRAELTPQLGFEF